MTWHRSHLDRPDPQGNIGDIFGDVSGEPFLSFPVEIMGGIGRIGDINGDDAAALLLRDTLKNPLRTERSTRADMP
jgi:hypothetical protein